ncbi:MAG TPA: NUDIX domain-containing protein [Kofleriaceae bacterium]
MIRTSVKAVIIRDGHILLTACRDENGEFFLLPGGGQERFESLPDALRRECREEIATDVEVGQLLVVRDYIARNHEFAALEPETHQLEIMFACHVPADYVPANGAIPDPKQVGVKWIPLAELANVRLYPAALAPLLVQRPLVATYLGDVN